MLLKDCPVGSFVQLESLGGGVCKWRHWIGEFEVKKDRDGEKYVIDGNGTERFSVSHDHDYQFKIVTPEPSTHKTITLNGKTYKLKPYTEPRLIVIDGVTYEMEEI